jgi:Transposase DDE domain
MSFSRLNYCQFLLCSPWNYTQTCFADHVTTLSHDQINRALPKLDVSSDDLWQSVQETIVFSKNGYLAYDDTVLDKRHSVKIEMAQKQWSGNEHKVIMGIGVVTCVYVNPDTQQFWAIDYRFFNPSADGKSKLDHVTDMLNDAVDVKKLPFKTVLIDSWYADQRLMLHIGDTLKKIYYTVVKKNRLIAEHRGQHAWQSVESLDWDEEECQSGKRIRLNDFPKEHKCQLFRVSVLTNRTDYVVTNDLSQHDVKLVKAECGIRWKIEQFHRELKQETGVDKCQCRKAKAQQNHIGCAMLVWARLKNLAYQSGQTLYQLSHSQYTNWLTNLLEHPVIQMTTA